jgi:hypothetical protein
MSNVRLLIAFDSVPLPLDNVRVIDLADNAATPGHGDVDYACPHCRTALLLRIVDSTPFGVTLFRCHCCRHYCHFGVPASSRRH